MAYTALFVIIALLEIFSAVFVFFFKDILHAVLALSMVFVFNSALFLVLAQPLLALIQLFVMVGGVSTYIFVGVASPSYSKFRGTNYVAFAAIYLVILLVFTVKVAQISPSAIEQNTVSSTLISETLSSNAGLLYILTILLFGTGFGSIMLMRKLSGKS